jgi:hypothetical protein
LDNMAKKWHVTAMSLAPSANVKQVAQVMRTYTHTTITQVSTMLSMQWRFQ